MFSCDYNGWADVPEEEREGIDVFEALQPVAEGPMLVLMLGPSLISPPENVDRLAA
ncbi:MAG TPA: hypothetical protein VFX42_05535 [Gemmatimonadales bacterium]|nr:hypothetical protein [Gemmatimonadales bacterium]